MFDPIKALREDLTAGIKPQDAFTSLGAPARKGSKKQQSRNLLKPLPREKLEDYGITRLNNTELISLLLGSGNQSQPVSKLAEQVYEALLQEPLACSLESLRRIKGMGLGKSASILAAIELGRRLLCPSPRTLNTPEDIFRYLVQFADQQENLVTLSLNGACELISVRLITRGTINRSLLHPREIFTHAVREQANSIILAHNHPSGLLEPSEEDLLSTKRLLEAGDILGIRLLDHIIFSPNEYRSLAQGGELQQLMGIPRDLEAKEL